MQSVAVESAMYKSIICFAIEILMKKRLYKFNAHLNEHLFQLCLLDCTNS